MTYLPLGLTVTPCAYAASVGSFTAFPATTKGLRLGEREIDGSAVSLHLEHGGSSLDWSYVKASTDLLHGSWRAGKLAEWGLRFWVILVFRLDPDADGNLRTWLYDPAGGVLSAEANGRRVTVKGDAPPLMATFHDTIDELEAELRQFGYFYLKSRGIGGKVAPQSRPPWSSRAPCNPAWPARRSTRCATWSAGTRCSIRSTAGPICR
jgi:putative isomerase